MDIEVGGAFLSGTNDVNDVCGVPERMQTDLSNFFSDYNNQIFFSMVTSIKIYKAEVVYIHFNVIKKVKRLCVYLILSPK